MNLFCILSLTVRCAVGNVTGNESYLFLSVTMHLLKLFYFIFFKVKKIGQLASFFGCVPRYFKLFFVIHFFFISCIERISLTLFAFRELLSRVYVFYAILGVLFDQICGADEHLHLNQASPDKMNLDS